MTSAVHAPARTLRAVPSSDETWTDFVRSQIKPDWRSGEWDEEAMQFRGDPQNSLTKTYACPTVACSTRSSTENGFCNPCGIALKRSNLPRGEFIAQHRPQTSRHAAWGWFTLAGCTQTLRAELVYALQRRDEESIVLSPDRVRSVLAHVPTSTQSLLDLTEVVVASLSAADAGFVRTVQMELRRLDSAFHGADPTDGDVWDCALVGLRADPNRPYVAVTGALDFTVVRQPWLRELIKQYGRDTRPSVSEMRRTLQATEIESPDALTPPPRHHTAPTQHG